MPKRERGPWIAKKDEADVWVESSDFTHDVLLFVRGDFATASDKLTYAFRIADALNAAMPLKF